MEEIYYIVSVLCKDKTVMFLKEDRNHEGPCWLVDEIEKATKYENRSAAEYDMAHIKENIAGIYRDEFDEDSVKLMKCTVVTTYTYEEV